MKKGIIFVITVVSLISLLIAAGCAAPAPAPTPAPAPAPTPAPAPSPAPTPTPTPAPSAPAEVIKWSAQCQTNGYNLLH